MAEFPIVELEDQPPPSNPLQELCRALLENRVWIEQTVPHPGGRVQYSVRVDPPSG